MRVKPEGPVIVRDRLVVLVHGIPDDTAITVVDWVLGIDTDGLVAVGDSLVVLPLCDPDVAPIDVGESVLGIDTDGLVVVGDGLVVLARCLPHGPPVAVDAGVPGGESDRLVAVAQGEIEVFRLFAPELGSHRVTMGVARTGADVVCEVLARSLDGDDLIGLGPAAQTLPLGLEPKPVAIDLLDAVDFDRFAASLHVLATDAEFEVGDLLHDTLAEPLDGARVE